LPEKIVQKKRLWGGIKSAGGYISGDKCCEDFGWGWHKPPANLEKEAASGGGFAMKVCIKKGVVGNDKPALNGQGHSW